ncbi:hypothetical protein PGTUg99_028129 [Puccinia graminis f. sp. tritici]|uniref:Chromo domain-containing protein n=1 Tax=Puccinia graminis f. sp. tritici TaxID=56615 RepID=A0A5B0MY43_PUCGR|nr:hypothetical protein PGTUg99_028129 [Puccinia graminis f. sp. tritici]
MAESSSQETEWEAIEILKERGGKYYIRWAGIDPETNKAWKPTWEPKSLANELLVEDWKEKKRKRKRRSSTRNSYRSESISYWSSTHSTTAKTTADLTRRSTRLSMVDNPHSTPSSSSIISTKRKRRKTHETSTPASPVSSKLHSIHDHQSSPQPSTPSQLNSSQKLKQTVIPETQSQSDEELDTGNQKTKANPSVNPNRKTPNRLPMTSSSLPEDPLQVAKNSRSKRKQKKPGPTPPANPTPKTPIRLPLTSSSLPEEPIREAEDSISKRKQKKLKPNPPAAADPNPKTSTRDHLSPSPTQDPPEPAEDSDGPATPTQETSQAQDIALNLFSNDSSSHHSSEVEDEYSNLGQARTPNPPSPLLSSNNDQVTPPRNSYEPDAETADLIASLNDYDDPDHLSRMVRYISRSSIDADDKRFILKFINDPLSYLADPTNEIEQLRQEHTLGGYLGFEIKRQKAGSINLWLQGLGGSHPSWVVRWDSAKDRKKVAKLLFRYPSSRKRSCSDTSESRVSERTDAKPEPSHLSKDPDDHQSCSSQSHQPQEAEIEPNPPVPDDNPAPFDDHESESSELPHAPTPSPPADAPPDDIHADAPPDDIHADAPPDDIHTDAAPDEIHTDAPLDDIHTDSAPDEIPTDAPFDEIQTDSPPDENHTDPAVPLSTGLSGELQPETAISPEDEARPRRVEHLLNETATGEGRSEVEPISNDAGAAGESQSQVEPFSIEADTDREDRMSKEELRGALIGLRVLLKGALEASAHQENNADETSRLQADLQKEKETVAELKNRLRDQDGEITGRQADLEKEKETVAELKNRLQDQDAEITRQQALQADLKKQNETVAAELNNRLRDQDVEINRHRALRVDLNKENEAVVAELKNRLGDQHMEITRHQALQADLKKENEALAEKLKDRLRDQDVEIIARWALAADLEKEQETVAKLENRLRERDVEITGRQADLKKEKEAVAELKQRLRDQDVEITGRRVELMNYQVEVDRLQTKVKSLESLLATEEKQPARLLYEKFTHRQKQELSQAQAESRLAREACKRLERQKKISEEKNNELMKSFAEQNEDLRNRLESANAKIYQQFAQIEYLKMQIRDLEETEEIQRRSIEHLKDKLEISGSTLEDEEESTADHHQDETPSSNPIVPAAAAAANEENAENSLTFHPISQLERCSLGALRPSNLVNQSLQTMTSEHDHHHRQEDSSQTIEEEDSQGRIKSSAGLRSTSHFETLSPSNSSSSVDPRRSCPPPNGQKTFKIARSSLQFSSPLCLPRLGTSLTTPTSVATSSRLHQPPP